MTQPANSDDLVGLLPYTLDSFQFRNRVTDEILNINRLVDYQANASSFHRKAPEWALDISLRSPLETLPVSIKSVAVWAEKFPGVTLPKIYQDILLTYFGNHTRKIFTDHNWDLSKLLATVKPETLDPWTVLEKVAGKNTAVRCKKMCNANTGYTMSLAYWLACYADQYEVHGTYNRRIYRLMHQNKIALPVSELQTDYSHVLGKYQTVINFDKDTGEILDPNNPAPAKPALTEEAKKKEEASSDVAVSPPVDAAASSTTNITLTTT